MNANLTDNKTAEHCAVFCFSVIHLFAVLKIRQLPVILGLPRPKCHIALFVKL